MMHRGPIIAIVVGLITATALIAGSYVSQASAPSVVRLNGVALDITYLNGSSPIFGPTVQNACNETDPAGPGLPLLVPTCPSELVNGASYNVPFFVTGNPGHSPGLWTNMTVTAPFAFQLFPAPSGSPNSASTARGDFEANQTFLYQVGAWTSWDMVFALPSSFGPVAGGLWLQATLTVQPTNQTLFVS